MAIAGRRTAKFLTTVLLTLSCLTGALDTTEPASHNETHNLEAREPSGRLARRAFAFSPWHVNHMVLAVGRNLLGPTSFAFSMSYHYVDKGEIVVGSSPDYPGHVHWGWHDYLDITDKNATAVTAYPQIEFTYPLPAADIHCIAGWGEIFYADKNVLQGANGITNCDYTSSDRSRTFDLKFVRAHVFPGPAPVLSGNIQPQTAKYQGPPNSPFHSTTINVKLLVAPGPTTISWAFYYRFTNQSLQGKSANLPPAAGWRFEGHGWSVKTSNTTSITGFPRLAFKYPVKNTLVYCTVAWGETFYANKAVLNGDVYNAGCWWATNGDKYLYELDPSHYVVSVTAGGPKPPPEDITSSTVASPERTGSYQNDQVNHNFERSETLSQLSSPGPERDEAPVKDVADWGLSPVPGPAYPPVAFGIRPRTEGDPGKSVGQPSGPNGPGPGSVRGKPGKPPSASDLIPRAERDQTSATLVKRTDDTPPPPGWTGPPQKPPKPGNTHVDTDMTPRSQEIPDLYEPDTPTNPYMPPENGDPLGVPSHRPNPYKPPGPPYSPIPDHLPNLHQRSESTVKRRSSADAIVDSDPEISRSGPLPHPDSGPAQAPAPTKAPAPAPAPATQPFTVGPIHSAQVNTTLETEGTPLLVSFDVSYQFNNTDSKVIGTKAGGPKDLVLQFKDPEILKRENDTVHVYARVQWHTSLASPSDQLFVFCDVAWGEYFSPTSYKLDGEVLDYGCYFVKSGVKIELGTGYTGLNVRYETRDSRPRNVLARDADEFNLEGSEVGDVPLRKADPLLMMRT